MRYVLAFFLPWLSLILQGKIGSGIICLIFTNHNYRLDSCLYMGFYGFKQDVCRQKNSYDYHGNEKSKLNPNSSKQFTAQHPSALRGLPTSNNYLLSEIPQIKICGDYFHLSPHFCGKYKSYLPHEYQKTKYAIQEFHYSIRELNTTPFATVAIIKQIYSPIQLSKKSICKS